MVDSKIEGQREVGDEEGGEQRVPPDVPEETLYFNGQQMKVNWT